MFLCSTSGPDDAAITEAKNYVVTDKVFGACQCSWLLYDYGSIVYTGRHAMHVLVVPNVAAEPVQYVIDTSVAWLVLFTCVRIACLGCVKYLK